MKEPKYLGILRKVGFCLLAAGVILIILGVFVFRVSFGSDDDMMNFALFVPGMFILVSSIPCISMGFSAKINKLQIETMKYMQQSNKDDLKTMADTTVDISSDAITNTIKSIKRGIKDSVYCKHCGKEIDRDSKFCKHCGKEQ